MPGSLLLWPNPTSGAVTVEHANGLNKLRIRDTYGRLILIVTNTDHFDTAGWARGIYFVESLEAKGDRIIARLMVE